MATMAILQRTFSFILIFSIALHLKSLFAMETDSGAELKYLELIHEANEFTPDEEYDYIVVGGGTAGCPLAATLSENYSVLVLERGGDQHSHPNIIRQENVANNALPADDENSPSQAFTSEDGVPGLVRGRVLGGSSMINFGFYSRGDDYFFKNTGIEWDMDSVKTAYEWVEETLVHRPDNVSTWESSVRDALLEVGVLPDNGNTLDHLVGTKVSGSTFDSTGNRHGAVELLNKANPNNLRVIVHATVDRIIFSSSESSGPSVVRVVYHDSHGKSYQVGIRENGEVILSAGAFGSPQLLLVSGVGPSQNLTSLEIPVVHDQPFVGQYMIDNPRINLALMLPFSVVDSGTPVVGITGKGSYIETTSSSTPFTSPVSPLYFPYPYPPVNISMGYFFGKVSNPTSAGSLWLKSPSDVAITPSVRFNYFSKPEDVHQCADAVATYEKILKTKAMEMYKFKDHGGEKYFQIVGRQIPENTSDFESMATYCRKTVTTFYHYCGGCTVNKVVDSNLKVVGIGGLRVVDNSVFTSSPGTNPQATTMMLGRYMGVKIQQERAGSDGDN
uniref:Sinalpyl alcohol oxidase Nec3 n=1 Tax=Nesocodon mauritianus TaxID=519296 RepID=NEC3_NESMA|nr:RecName: Full=Sinalpyl alcohol oxidase Nec3; AltName: Full=Nectar protein 3; Short=NmNec3; Flags: Precursor [Nesocodon mauritianus]UIE54578.1 Nec3 [Nesocodon mauritianus]